MSDKIKLSKEDLLQELKDVTDHITLLLDQILNKKKVFYTKAMSVDLRKLYSPTKGDDLLKRVEDIHHIKFLFPDSRKTLPPAIVKVGLNEYRNNVIFTIQGRSFSRLKLINLVAGQKGAHTDGTVDKIHYQSERILILLGNLARGGVLLEQNAMYLVSIARTTVNMLNKFMLIHSSK